MKATTTNLGSYPIRKRLVVWQAIHKKLLGDDRQYRQRFHSYLFTVVFLSCVLLPFYLPFFGVRVFGFAADLDVILGVGAVMVFLALRQLRFMHQRITHYNPSPA